MTNQRFLRVRRRVLRSALLIPIGAVSTATAVVLPIAPASAHATFLSPTTAAVGSDIQFTLDVPHERDEDTYNVVVRVKIPDGWRGVSCDAFPTWTCSIGAGEIDFSKAVGSAPAQDETFRFVAHADVAGRAVFPVVQIYSTGENVLWQDTATITAVGSTPSSSIAPVDPPPTSVVPVEVGSSDGGDPTTTGVVDGKGAGPSGDVVSEGESGAGDPAAPGLRDRSSSAIGGSETDAEVRGSGRESGSGSVVVIAVISVLIGGGVGSVLLVARRRRSRG